MKVSPVFVRLIEAFANPRYKIFILQGGVSSTKTTSALQLFYCLANRLKMPKLFSIVSESFPHLSKGAIRDFIGANVMGEDFREEAFNKTEHSIQAGRSIIEFFSVDIPYKARGPRRDYLYINEANRLNRDAADNLMVRTREKKIIDFNPTHRFWAHDLIGRDDVWTDISTYRDNPFLSKDEVADIESRRKNKNWWRVYGEGQVGSIEGLIIPEYELIDKMPAIDTDIGIDFGFTNDPTACIEGGVRGDNIYLNQLFYRRGMTKNDIIDEFRRLKVPLDYYIFGDGEDPRLIAEIRQAGYNIKAAVRERGIFKLRVDFLRRFKIHITKDSHDLIRDCQNAMWEEDPTGLNNPDGSKRYLNEPEKGFLHGLDGAGYSQDRRIRPLSMVRAGSRAA